MKALVNSTWVAGGRIWTLGSFRQKLFRKLSLILVDVIICVNFGMVTWTLGRKGQWHIIRKDLSGFGATVCKQCSQFSGTVGTKLDSSETGGLWFCAEWLLCLGSDLTPSLIKWETPISLCCVCWGGGGHKCWAVGFFQSTFFTRNSLSEQDWKRRNGS